MPPPTLKLQCSRSAEYGNICLYDHTSFIEHMLQFNSMAVFIAWNIIAYLLRYELDQFYDIILIVIKHKDVRGDFCYFFTLISFSINLNRRKRRDS